MKKVIFCISAFMMFLTAAAQEETTVLRHRGFETNAFIDNWEISAGVGGTFYQKITSADYLNMGGFGAQLGFTYNVSVGKWVTPVFGARVQFQGGSFNTMYDVTKAGQLVSVEKNNAYNYLHTDVMVNLTNWICGYKHDRFYNAILVGGFGWITSATDEMSNWNDEYGATVGLLNKFRMCESVDLNLEIKDNIVKQDFDNGATDGAFAMLFDVTVGASWKIPTKKVFVENNRDEFLRKIALLERDVQKGNKTIAENEEEIGDLESKLKKAQQEVNRIEEELATRKALGVPTANQSLSIFFRLDDSKITDRNMENLKFLAEAIQADKSESVFVITGYADKQTGSESYNEELSKKRAESVYNYLVELGVAKNRLKIDYKGSVEQPFTGKAYMNRVVVIKR